MNMNLKGGLFRRRHNCDKDRRVGECNDGKKLEKTLSVKKLQEFCQYKKNEFYSFEKFVKLLHKPTCSSSLGVVRALFGLMMVIDIPDERGLGDIGQKFGDPMRCHFPLFDWLSPLPLKYMCLLYTVMWLGALGICIGFKFQTSCLMFILPYWYIYILDKTVWNNHSYLYGLVAILFTFTNANYSFSVDALLDSQSRNKEVPLWNYTIIRFQFFLLYFYAGVKKFDPDWIGGYSVPSLGLHWVFNPFRLVLNNDQIDFWIIHIFGFIFDLTVGFFLLVEKTRPLAMVFSTAFHVMNSFMFSIGQFPYVCLVTTPIFCSYNWPDQLMKLPAVLRQSLKKTDVQSEVEKVNITRSTEEISRVTCKEKMTCYLLAIYVGFQLFLPYSHFITQGYNNWTNGLYGYSWDMMVKNWDSNIIVVRVVDNQSKEEYFLDPEAWVGNTRYSKHGDMLIQYAKCLKRNLKSPEIAGMKDVRVRSSFDDISIYVDVWCSLNGRFRQRMFDPRQDLLTAEWSPFKKISWLMPLLSELSHWRKNFTDLEEEVFNWSNYSDVLFVADFPGLHLENYIGPDFTNVTLTVLRGIVLVEQFNRKETLNVTLFKGDSVRINEGMFHKVHTISDEPSCYMYTYNNSAMEKLNYDTRGETDISDLSKENIFIDNLKIRFKKFRNSLLMVQSCFKKLLYNL